MQRAENLTVSDPEKLLRDKCGVVGLYYPQATRDNQITIAMNATVALWHRGQQGAGITIKDAIGLKEYHGKGSFEQTFPPSVVSDLKQGNTPSWIISQTRYGTYGDWQDKNLQPITTYSQTGEPVTVAHNGQFTSIAEMRKRVPGLPEGLSDTYIFARLLADAEGNSMEEKITKSVHKMSGAFSLVIGVGDSLYAARDRQGIKPLVIGKLENGFIVASETFALDKTGATLLRSIKPGEIVRINTEGLQIIQEGNKDGHFCDFEWEYFSRPESSYPLSPEDLDNPEEWVSTYQFREEVGKTLALEHPIPNASFIIGMPDSGIPIALGYANTQRIPYRQLIIRDHYDPNGQKRMFQTDYDRNGIVKRVLGKLSIVRDPKIWKNAIAVIADDSIVRGDASKAMTEIILDAGAKEVHWVSGFPQVRHTCYLGISMRTSGELIAEKNNGSLDLIAREIGAKSVGYISHEGFIRARLKSGHHLVMPKDKREIFLANGGCGGCLTGLYPVSKEGVIYTKTTDKH